MEADRRRLEWAKVHKVTHRKDELQQRHELLGLEHLTACGIHGCNVLL